MDDCFGIDYGGTQLRIGRVDPEDGTVLDLITLPSARYTSNEALVAAVAEHLPAGALVGISAAGDVDEAAAVVRLAPNAPFAGPITLGADLRSRGYQVAMLNDIRAAAQGEAWFGDGNRSCSIAVATYSTGFNCAFAGNGVVSSRRAEVGHAMYNGGMSLRCGCGGLDHLESYVSGSGTAAMARRMLVGRNPEHRLFGLAREAHGAATGSTPSVAAFRDDPDLMAAVLARIDAAMVYRAYREAPFEQPQHQIRDIQCRAIAVSLSLMIHFYNKLDKIILMGSQTKDWDILFEPAIAEVFDGGMMPSLSQPTIGRTTLSEIGVQGAVASILVQRQ